MEIKIRQELPDDYGETEEMTREAFWNHYSPGCVEHYLVHILRDCPSFVPELDLVAVCDGKIVGNIMSVRGVIKGDDRRDYEVLSVGPLSVHPEYQKQGIGTMLLNRTKEIARDMGFQALMLCGDPAYYAQHDFTPAAWKGIRNSEGMYAIALQNFELQKNALEYVSGRYYEDEVYEVDETLAEEFDRSFPPKEKLEGVQMQERFEKIAAMTEKAKEPYRRPAKISKGLKASEMFSAVIGVLFAVLGLLKIVPYGIANPLMLVGVGSVFLVRAEGFRRALNRGGFYTSLMTAGIAYAVAIFIVSRF